MRLNRFSFFAFCLWIAATGCTRNRPGVDFTKLDFAMPRDGGVLPDGFVLPDAFVPDVVDFAVDNPPVVLPDMARSRVDLAGADLTSVGAVDLAGLDLAGVDMTGGAGCGAFADRPLSWFVQNDVAMTASGPLTVTVPDGVVMTGTVTLQSAPAGGSFVEGGVSFGNNTLGSSGTSLVQQGADGKSFTYSLVLQPGTYSTTFHMAFDLAASVSVTRLGRSTVTVCGPTTHNHALTPLPTLTPKTVTATGLSALDPLNDANAPRGAYMLISDTQHTLLITGPFGAETAGSASLSMPLPEISLLPTLWVGEASKTTMPEVGGWATYFQLPTATVTTSYTFPLPAVSKLTGTVTLGTQLTDTSVPALVTCREPSPTRLYDETTSAEVRKAAPSYHTFFRTGASCLLQGLYVVKMANTGTASANKDAFLVHAPSGTPITVDADKVNNLTVPTLATPVAISGQLRDMRGGQLRGYHIRATSSAINGLSSSNYALVVDVQSDTNGNFVLNVLPGTYDLEVTSYD
jgi:hypothetical protein